jgi:hypothetical protein
MTDRAFGRVVLPLLITLAACGAPPVEAAHRPTTLRVDPTPVETIHFAPLEQLARRPIDWSTDFNAPRAWPNVEFGYVNGSYFLVATHHSNRWGTQLACCADGFVLESFELGPTIAGIETASIVFDVNNDGGKRIELVVCARDKAPHIWENESLVVRCSQLIELLDGDLSDALDYRLVPARDGLVLWPTGKRPKRRLVFALP